MRPIWLIRPTRRVSIPQLTVNDFPERLAVQVARQVVDEEARHELVALRVRPAQVRQDDDLVAAVKEKRSAGAVLYVYRQEPLPAEHPFWTTKGIVVLPHLGGPHPQRDKFVARLFVDNLARFLDGKPLREVVDRKLGY